MAQDVSFSPGLCALSGVEKVKKKRRGLLAHEQSKLTENRYQPNH